MPCCAAIWRGRAFILSSKAEDGIVSFYPTATGSDLAVSEARLGPGPCATPISPNPVYRFDTAGSLSTHRCPSGDAGLLLFLAELTVRHQTRCFHNKTQ